MKQSTTYCDICKEGGAENENYPLTVVFTTETNEGRATEPYLDNVKIDMCNKCRAKIIAGNMLFAEGAMGYNRYYFLLPEPKKECSCIFIDDATGRKWHKQNCPQEPKKGRNETTT